MTRADEGGDPACWAHLLETPSDIADRADVEWIVRDFYRQAAMDDVLGPVFAAMARLVAGVSDVGEKPVDAVWVPSQAAR